MHDPESSGAPAAARDAVLFPPGLGTEVAPRRARWILVLILLLAFGLRSRDLFDPWSGKGLDFRSQFGGFATGGPARNFAQHGFGETLGMPYYWRLELADGTVDHGWYAHHPALFAVLTGVSLTVFGVEEWAARLPWLLFNLLSIVSLYRLVAVLWGRRPGIWAAFWCAVLPLSVFVGTMVWVDTAVVWLYCLLLRQYVLWLRSERAAHLAWAALWAFTGGMFEWTSLYVLPGLGLHALWFCWRRGSFGRLLRAASIPLAAAAAVGVHKLHMHLVLPPSTEGDTSSTLAWVTRLHGEDTLGRFLRNQVGYFERYLTWPVLLVSDAVLVALLILGLRGRLKRDDWLFLTLLAPGLVYIGLFPARSTNHDFFVFLSLPWFCMALTAAFAWLEWLLTRAAAPARPIVLAAILAVTALCGHRNFMLWALRYSPRLDRLVHTEWLAPVLADEDVVLFPLTVRWLPLHFHARATVIHEFTSDAGGRTAVERLTDYRDRVLSRLGPEKRVLVLIDQEEAAELAVSPTSAELLALLERVGRREAHELPPLGPRDVPRAFWLVDLTEWSHGAR